MLKINSVLSLALSDALNDAVALMTAWIDLWLTSPNASADLELAFGTSITTDVIAKFLNEENSVSLQVHAATDLQGALGAYGTATDTIYLNQDFLATASPEEVATVLLEEIGHAIDARLNTVDSLGDEGAIFSALVRGIDLNPTQLQSLQSEVDTGYVTIGETRIAVEQATYDYSSMGIARDDGQYATPIIYSLFALQDPYNIAESIAESVPLQWRTWDTYHTRYASFVDIDDDGDLDLFIGMNGFTKPIYDQLYKDGIYYLENIGTAQNPIYTTPIAQPFNLPSYDSSTYVDDPNDGYGSYYADSKMHLQFKDLDGDGDLDALWMGSAYQTYNYTFILYDKILYNQTRVYYSLNIGTQSSPIFSSAQSLRNLVYSGFSSNVYGYAFELADTADCETMWHSIHSG